MDNVGNIIICYPSDLLLGARHIDDAFVDESKVAYSLGYEIAIIDVSEGTIYYNNSFKALDHDFKDHRILYRGWMLTAEEYAKFNVMIMRRGGTLYTTNQDYACAHYLPNWLDAFKGETALTRFYENPVKVETVITDLPNWNGYFFKDYVKSYYGYHQANNKLELPSVLEHLVIHENLQHGLIVREKSPSLSNGTTELRCWHINGEWIVGKHPQHSHVILPKIPQDYLDLLSERIKSLELQFISVDLYWDKDIEAWKVIEIGDGQVSGLGEISDFEKILELL